MRVVPDVGGEGEAREEFLALESASSARGVAQQQEAQRLSQYMGQFQSIALGYFQLQ